MSECRCLKGQRCLACIERDGLTRAPVPNLGPCDECGEHGVDRDHTGADGRSVCDECRHPVAA